MYFYFRRSGWEVSVSLPADMRLDRGHYVMLEMDTDHPYQYHREVVEHYPPGPDKNKSKGRGKGRRN